jgi:hypothetical protein
MKRVILFALLASACADSAGDGGGVVDAGGAGDGGPVGCVLSVFPLMPEASAVAPVRVSINSGAAGVFVYEWTVFHDSAPIPHTVESSQGDQIIFIAIEPGIYDVSVTISGGFTSCPFASAPITVRAPGANSNIYRLRAVPPPATGVPPQEQVIEVDGGGDAIKNISLDPGITAAGTVRNGMGGPGIPAYLKFMPGSAPLAFTERFTTAGGSYSTKLVGVTHDVLVIPESTTLAPKLVTWTPTTTSLVVGPGQVVTGTVRNPAATGLAGAKVQLMANGVPSTIATTAGDGSFSLRADFPAGSTITVNVTPPAASGLPRLQATGTFTLTSAMQINFSAALQTCNLSSTPVRRDTVNQPGAKVTVVGTLAVNAGTVTAGAAANALGTVRIAASADGSGLLPSVLVPRAATLSAVTQLGPTDFAVDGLDTSACPALVIDAPALAVAAGIAKTPANGVLDGLRVEATPVGVLALADAQTISTTTDSNGAFSLALAANGHYDVRFVDPQARVARREDSNFLPGSIPDDVIMPLAVGIRGKVSISSTAQPLPLTSIMLLCTQCSSGVDAARPIAHATTNGLSEYRLAVPDPGTM